MFKQLPQDTQHSICTTKCYLKSRLLCIGDADLAEQIACHTLGQIMLTDLHFLGRRTKITLRIDSIRQSRRSKLMLTAKRGLYDPGYIQNESL